MGKLINRGSAEVGLLAGLGFLPVSLDRVPISSSRLPQAAVLLSVTSPDLIPCRRFTQAYGSPETTEERSLKLSSKQADGCKEGKYLGAKNKI